MRNILVLLPTLAIALGHHCLTAAEPQAGTALQDGYQQHARPLLQKYCIDCHGAEKPDGNVRLDEERGIEPLLADKRLWWNVLKNVRAHMMPPATAESPASEQRRELIEWIETAVSGVDPQHPDPGPSSLRRLNRAEYRQTIQELMGIDFNAEIVFPPDDTGFGFDNVGDALSMSPMLLEKNVQSASAIVAEAVPVETWIKPTVRIAGHEFRSSDGPNGDRIRHNQPCTVTHVHTAKHAGHYKINIRQRLHGSFDFHPGRYAIEFRLDEAVLYREEYKWEEHKEVPHEFEVDWQPGPHRFSVKLETLADKEKDENADPSQANNDSFVSYQLVDVTVVGPIDSELREHPARYERFFSKDEPPSDAQQRQEYARELLTRFATRAFRQPVSSAVVDRLAALATQQEGEPQSSFEAGVARAMTAILASPKFLFKLESPDEKIVDISSKLVDASSNSESASKFPLVSEYSLASRLSYFLWSSMPDAELFELASQSRLRDQQARQVERMLRDDRGKAFASNFVGQWLRARDVEHISIDPVAALGYGREYDELRQRLQGRFRRRRGDPPPDEETARALTRFRELIGLREKLSASVRTAMRRETELAFETIVQEDRSLLELLDADYVFVNSELAELYGIADVKGKEMRRVQLPPGSPRGGVLTQGTMLLVTSNPTRTSPVKRGLFVLDNLLGTPAPPAPPNVPALEDAQNRFGDREPTLRELLAVHRESALCASCHARMDPLGLALENFNAFGGFRESEKGQPIDASGQLITGEKFSNVAELKRILVTSRRADFYRCVTEKMLVFALGRGLEMQDEWTVDKIVQKLEASGGKFSALLNGVVESAPFQRCRR